jgi:WD40 repeat protein
MDAEQLQKCEQQLYNHTPLLGARWRRQAVEALAKDGSPPAVQALAEAVAHSDDADVRAAALDALGRLARRKVAAREALCRLVLEHDHTQAAELACAAGYAPRHPQRRALFYFLTSQWEQYEQLDFDSRLLRAAYQTAAEPLRARIRRQARQAGRVEWVDAVAGGRQGRPVAEMTAAEWETALTMLADSHRWDEIWELAKEAPPRWSAHLVQRLREEHWSPDGPEQAWYEELLRLAVDQDAPALGGLLRCRKALHGHTGAVHCLAFHPGCHFLASGGEDGTVRLWDVTDGRLLQTLHAHDGAVRCLALTPDGQVLASAGGGTAVRLWSVPGGEPLQTLEKHRAPVICLALSPNGRFLASGSEDTCIRLWSLPEGRSLKTLAAHQEPVNCLRFTPDGRRLVSAGGAWHPEWAPEDGDYKVRLWSVPRGQLLRTLEGHRNWISSLSVSPDGRYLASGGTEVLIWALTDGKRRSRDGVGPALLRPSRPIAESRGMGNWTSCLAMSPDGRVLAGGTMDRMLGLWRLPDGALTVLAGHERAISCLTFSPDGRLLISGSEDHTLRLWDVAESRELKTLTGHTQPVTCLALRADGRMVASGSGDSTIRLWESELVRLNQVPVGRISPREWTWVQETLRRGAMSEAERTGLEYIAALLRWRRRADIVVEDAAPRRIAVGEFDVEIEG